MDFNSRPHEEVDRQLRSIKCHRLHFNSRPREEVDISYCPRRAGLLLFQLTTSQGGRLIRSVNTANCLYFNSRPHEEVDRIRLFQTVESIISTHDLAKRSTRYLCRFSSSITFQLTTSRRGRRSSPLTSSCTQYFNSRPHEEVDRWSSSVSMVERLFQLTTSRRGRHVFLPKVDGRGIISTHDLTKRSTYIGDPHTVYRSHFNSRPHEEVDQRYVRHRNFFHHFNSRPHEEVDVSTAGDESYGNISTHDLTKRSTMLSSSEDNKAVFQLTTSRRGRRFNCGR